MKRILILLLLIIILSGCSAKYELSYKNSLFDEKLTINNYKIDRDLEFLIDHYKNDNIYSDVNDKILTTKEIIEKKNYKYDLSFNSKYDIASYDTSLALTSCFEYYTYEENENSIYISLYGEYLCDDFDKLKIVFDTDRKINYSNAHNTLFGKLIWNFKPNDRMEIELEILKNEKKEIDLLMIFYVLCCFVVFILLTIFSYKCVIKYKSNRSV